LTDEDVAYWRALCAHNATIDQAVVLGQRFLVMVWGRQPDALDGRLADAEASSIKELRNLAKSLRHDHAAVHMALASEWNNGQTEGHVNRLKFNLV
jgi:transposase